jgi:hypothetical protein
LKKSADLTPTIDLIATARYACYLPLVVLILGQLTAYLDRQTKNQHPSGYYYLSLDLWNVALLALPVVGIVWGAVAWRRTAGKLAIAINAAFLIYALAYPHHIPTGF